MNKKIVIAIIVVLMMGVAAFAISNLTSSGDAASLKIDTSALEDRGNGTLKLANSLINKTGDTATSGDDADFYGVNSGILVNTNGTLDISNVEIVTNSKGSNGIFVTNAESSTNGNSTAQSGDASQPPEAGGGGQPPEMPDANSSGQAGGQAPQMPDGNGGGQAPNGGGPGETTVSGKTEANINNVKITTHSDKSRGLDATYNGKITANNVAINTDGQSCAGLATDRGEGEVHVKNSQINTTHTVLPTYPRLHVSKVKTQSNLHHVN